VALGFLEEQQLLGSCLFANLAASTGPHSASQASLEDPVCPIGSLLGAVASAAIWRHWHEGRAAPGAGATSSGGGGGADVARRYSAPFVLAGLAHLAGMHLGGGGTDADRAATAQALGGRSPGSGGGRSSGGAAAARMPHRAFGHGRRAAAAEALAAALDAYDAVAAGDTAGGGAGSGSCGSRGVLGGAFFGALTAVRSLIGSADYHQHIARAAAAGRGGSGRTLRTSSGGEVALEDCAVLAPLHAALQAAGTLAAGPRARDSRRGGRRSRRRTGGGARRQMSGGAPAEGAAEARHEQLEVVVALRWAAALGGPACAPFASLHATAAGDAEAGAPAGAPEAPDATVEARMRALHAARAGRAVALAVAGCDAPVELPFDMARRCEALAAVVDMEGDDEEAPNEGGGDPHAGRMRAVPLPHVTALPPDAAARLLRVAVAFDALHAAAGAARAAAADAGGGGSGAAERGCRRRTGGSRGGAARAVDTVAVAEGASSAALSIGLEAELLLTAVAAQAAAAADAAASPGTAAPACGGEPAFLAGAGAGLGISKDEVVDLWLVADFLGYAPLFGPAKWLLARLLGPDDGEWAAARLAGHPLGPELHQIYARALICAWPAGGGAGAFALGARGWVGALHASPALLAAAAAAAADVVGACVLAEDG
jgi:hypothetical protein